ncbi:hypothetical protein SEPCBS57363_000664 [Sporothrix epigloea]|uniref:mannan endo-1,6-alpha-mannosidase n=1 Tax=Sporothrix epigloea TaxID=1892477 RepID=A0ABP0D9P1_9PEZI
MAAQTEAHGPRWSARSLCTSAVSALLLSLPVTTAYQLDTSSPDSIKSVAGSMVKDMLSFYNGDQPGRIPGLLPDPYYWWEAGAMLGSLVDYWYYTGDTQYNDLTTQGLLFQVGPYNDYMPPNQTLTEGNDDQGFWGLSVMTAAEYKFPNPPKGKPGWLALAQAVFNTQAGRWDSADCNGGLRWQIFNWNNGYDYKNSISQACFFNLAARLYLYTGNTTYSDWAVKTWNWMQEVKFLDDDYNIFDGAHIETGCAKITPYQWSYNAGAFLLGAAAMYNSTAIKGDTDDAAMWKERVDGMLNGTKIFFTTNERNIMTEVACEPVNLCDLDQQSFKAYLSRWMAATTKWAPWTTTTIMPLLNASAIAAAKQCTGGDNGQMCGLRWTDNGKWDGSSGVGQQMAAMEVTLANMITIVSAPVTNSTGGISDGNPNAGGSDIGRTQPIVYAPITNGDRAGAGILTAIVIIGIVSGAIYMFTDETVEQTHKERFSGFVATLHKSSRKLAKRATGGRDEYDDGLGGLISEKGKQPRVQSFRVIDRTDSDRSSGSVVVGPEGFFASRQSSLPSPMDAADPEKAAAANEAAAAAATPAPISHSFFSPAHFHHLNSNTVGTSAEMGGARTSSPGNTSVIQFPPVAATNARASANAPTDAAATNFASTLGTPRNFIRRKLLRKQQK